MGLPEAEEQLITGWFEEEQSSDRTYRWASRRAAVVVRLAESVSCLSVSYCMPPRPVGTVDVTIRPLGAETSVWSRRIAWNDGDWHDITLPVSLAEGDYVVVFIAGATWSNQGHRDPEVPPENRALGFALSRLSFQSAR